MFIKKVTWLSAFILGVVAIGMTGHAQPEPSISAETGVSPDRLSRDSAEEVPL